MNKYMGNKDRVLDSIYKEIVEFTGGDFQTLFDAFAGTNNVGKFFKQKGYRIIANDINDVSFVLGKAYIENNQYPAFKGLFSDVNNDFYSCRRLKQAVDSADFTSLMNKLVALNSQVFHPEHLTEDYDRIVMVLTYLSFLADRRDYSSDDGADFTITEENFIFRNYCEEGANSEYVNLVTWKSLKAQATALKKLIAKLEAAGPEEKAKIEKTVDEVTAYFESFGEKPFAMAKFTNGLSLIGSLCESEIVQQDAYVHAKLVGIYEKLLKLKNRNNHIGRRMFFTKEHGERIDLILNIILYWFRNRIISEQEYYYLLCSLLESVALFSNTSATYQAFYKTYRPNTLQEFRLVIPEVITSDREHLVYQQDTFNLIGEIDAASSVLYLDPPYNWRLYDSNYHLLNLIAKYHTIPDLTEYEKGIIGASGEYRLGKEYDYTNYNRRSTFEELLFQLVMKSNSDYIAISYSNSESNHNREAIEDSIQVISDFFQNPAHFSEFKVVNLNQIYNFESRKNQKKTPITELLFLAKKNN